MNNKNKRNADQNNYKNLILPNDSYTESIVIGTLLSESRSYVEVSDILNEKCFLNSEYQSVFQAIKMLGDVHKPIDIVTVLDKMKRNGTAKDSTAFLLSDLSGRVVSTGHLQSHCYILRDLYMKRELLYLSSDIQSKASVEIEDTEEILSDTERRLTEISGSMSSNGVCDAKSVLREAVKEIEVASANGTGFSGVQLGFHELDVLTTGFLGSELNIIAARPGGGKTSFVLSAIVNSCLHGDLASAMFSLEMSNTQLMKRLISNVCEIEYQQLKSGNLTQVEWVNMMRGLALIEKSKLYLDDTPNLSVYEFRSKARKLVVEHGVKIIYIDYLQLMSAPGKNVGSREQEIATISRMLKLVAKELNVPIIALSQLNRSVETRSNVKTLENIRPQLSDLRESGAIEQDADRIMFLYRPEYYNIYEDTSGASLRDVGMLVVAKNRDGSLADIKLRFQGKYTKFEDWDKPIYRGFDKPESETVLPNQMPIAENTHFSSSDTPF